LSYSVKKEFVLISLK